MHESFFKKLQADGLQFFLKKGFLHGYHANNFGKLSTVFLVYFISYLLISPLKLKMEPKTLNRTYVPIILDTGHKLNVHKAFRNILDSSERFIYVQFLLLVKGDVNFARKWYNAVISKRMVGMFAIWSIFTSKDKLRQPTNRRENDLIFGNQRKDGIH